MLFILPILSAVATAAAGITTTVVATAGGSSHSSRNDGDRGLRWRCSGDRGGSGGN